MIIICRNQKNKELIPTWKQHQKGKDNGLHLEANSNNLDIVTMEQKERDKFDVTEDKSRSNQKSIKDLNQDGVNKARINQVTKGRKKSAPNQQESIK